MKKIVAILFALIPLFGITQTSINPDAVYFKELRNYTSSNYILDIIGADYYEMNNDSLKVNYSTGLWFVNYMTLFSTNVNPANNLDSIQTIYHKKESDAFNDIVQGFPLAIIDTKVSFLKNGISPDVNLIWNGSELQYSGAGNPLETKQLFQASLLEDTLDIDEQLRINFDSSFWLTDSSYHYAININGRSYDVIPNDFIYVNLLEHSNLFVITNKELGTSQSFEIYGKRSISKGADNKSVIDWIINNLSVPSYVVTDPVMGGGKNIQYQVYYGCNNEDEVIKRPVIFIAGYNPANLRTFPKYLEIYNSNGLLDELHNRNYDIIITRFSDGADRIERHSSLLRALLKEINAKKFNNNSFEENQLIGYSGGAVVGRMGLKMMEHDYDLNSITENQHHSKLLISYDGEHEGANIPLCVQHSISSLINEPHLNGPLSPAVTIVASWLNANELIDSPMAKDYLIYHHSQTGNGSSPDQGAHPNYADWKSKFGTIYYSEGMAANTFSRPHDYPVVRNVAISQGSLDATQWHLGDYANPGGNPHIFSLEKNFNFLFQRHSKMDWYAVDGFQHSVFKRIEEKKWFWQSWETVLEENYAVHYSSKKLDGAPGSTFPIVPTMMTVMKFVYLKFSPQLEISENECFLPVKSALDISDGTGNYYYNVLGNGLLWDIPYDPITNPFPIYAFGYPSIIHGTSSYNTTPFDALYCSYANGPHGAKDERNLLDLTDFILSEIHHDVIYLQHKNLGWQYNSETKTYKCKYLAMNRIEMGQTVTFKAQQLPFYIFSNAEVEIQAGEEIDVMPGTSFNAGSTVDLYIQPIEDCSSGGKQAKNNEQSTGIEEKTGQADFITSDENSFSQVYPNPNQGNFTLLLNEESGNAFFYTLTGRLIQSSSLSEGDNPVQIDGFKGWVIVRVSIGEKVETHKICIE